MIAIASIILTIASMIWIGGFRISAVIHEVKNLGVRMDKMDVRMDKMEFRMEKGFERLEAKLDARTERLDEKVDTVKTDLHKVDLRVNTLENRKT